MKTASATIKASKSCGLDVRLTGEAVSSPDQDEVRFIDKLFDIFAVAA